MSHADMLIMNVQEEQGSAPHQVRLVAVNPRELTVHTSFLCSASWHLTPCSHKWGKWRAGVRDRVTRRFNLLLPHFRDWQLTADILFKLTPALKYPATKVCIHVSSHSISRLISKLRPWGWKSGAQAQGSRRRLLETQFSALSPSGAWPHSSLRV